MLPVQITTRDIPSSQFLETHIREKASKQTQFYKNITAVVLWWSLSKSISTKAGFITYALM